MKTADETGQLVAFGRSYISNVRMLSHTFQDWGILITYF